VLCHNQHTEGRMRQATQFGHAAHARSPPCELQLGLDLCRDDGDGDKVQLVCNDGCNGGNKGPEEEANVRRQTCEAGEAGGQLLVLEERLRSVTGSQVKRRTSTANVQSSIQSRVVLSDSPAASGVVHGTSARRRTTFQPAPSGASGDATRHTRWENRDLTRFSKRSSVSCA
jgi:hypothetical protein